MSVQSSVISLCCPACRAALIEESPRLWICPTCRANYRGLRGIPDLRVEDDVYLPNAADWSIALRLDEDFDRLDFEGLILRFFELSEDIPSADRSRYLHHIQTAPGRVGGWLDALGPTIDGLGLDLGCGSGSFLASTQAATRPWVGVDIAMRWLIVARKRLNEVGREGTTLVCAGSEHLPFADRTFSAIVSGDVIEHVRNQTTTLLEWHRVSKPGGRVFLATPNRFSLTPEPHVGVWGVGYLPRSWMSRYVRWRTGRDYRAIRNLGAGELGRLFCSTPYRDALIVAPGLPSSDLSHFQPAKRLLGRFFNQLVATHPGQWIGRRIGPILHAVAERREP